MEQPKDRTENIRRIAELLELKQNPTPTVTQKLRIQHLQQLLDK